MSVFTPETFITFNTPVGQQLLRKFSSTPVSQFRLEITPELVDAIMLFIQEYLDSQLLVKGFHTKLWTPESVNDIPSTIQAILSPESYSGKVKTLQDLFYQISQHVMMDTMGGFPPGVHPETQVTVSPVEFIAQQKLSFLEREINQTLTTKGIMLCPEWDHPEPTLNPGIQMLILDPTIHQGNSGKAVFYQGFDVTEYTAEELRRILGGEYDTYQEHFAVLQVSNYTLIMVHLKSLGTVKDIHKNAGLYRFMCRVREAFPGLTFMAGDFNLPLPGEEKGHLGFMPNDLHNYPLPDDEGWLAWSWRKFQSIFLTNTYDHMTRDFTRASYNPEDILGKDRSSRPFDNSQAWKGKFYDNRDYNTDQIYSSFGQFQNTRLTPTPKDIPKMPYVGRNVDGTDSWLSDHQKLTTEFTYQDENFTISVFNVLSHACLGKSPLRGDLTPTHIQAAEIEFSALLYKVYQAVEFL